MGRKQKCFPSKNLEPVQVESNFLFIRIIYTSILIRQSSVHDEKCM